jgi:outer membrane protein OmpA-like peptidoglycan-associated protein
MREGLAGLAGLILVTTATFDAGALDTGTGDRLNASGSSLLGDGETLKGSSSGLNAYETDLGTAFSLAADVLFDFDRAELKPAATPMMQELLTLIQQKQPRQIQIHGHTDSKGSDGYNLKLSQDRAAAVATWLLQNGVAAKLLASAGFGESSPIAPNEKPDGSDDPDGRQKNRRVDILFAKAFSAVKPLPPPH